MLIYNITGRNKASLIMNITVYNGTISLSARAGEFLHPDSNYSQCFPGISRQSHRHTAHPLLSVLLLLLTPFVFILQDRTTASILTACIWLFFNH